MDDEQVIQLHAKLLCSFSICCPQRALQRRWRRGNQDRLLAQQNRALGDEVSRYECASQQWMVHELVWLGRQVGDADAIVGALVVD
eukprot:6175835-Pleurochrysis_carterae.AAC.5